MSFWIIAQLPGLRDEQMRRTHGASKEQSDRDSLQHGEVVSNTLLLLWMHIRMRLRLQLLPTGVVPNH